MAGEVRARIVGGNIQLDATVATTNQPQQSASYVQADINAFVNRFNAVLAELRANGSIKP